MSKQVSLELANLVASGKTVGEAKEILGIVDEQTSAGTGATVTGGESEGSAPAPAAPVVPVATTPAPAPAAPANVLTPAWQQP